MKARIHPGAAVLLIALLALSSCGCLYSVEEGDEGQLHSLESIQVTSMEVDEDAEVVDVTVELVDEDGATRRMDGKLRIILVDSTGFEMYNYSRVVKADDFDHTVSEGDVYYWYEADVPFNKVKRSDDRWKSPKAGTEREMTATAWFVTSEASPQTVKGNPHDGHHFKKATIPPGLLKRNRVPEVVLEEPAYAVTGEPTFFNASGTMDDTGVGLLSFDWAFGDGSWRNTTEPFTEFVFAEPGRYTVTVTATDLDGSDDKATIIVEVVWAIDMTVDEWGHEDQPGEHEGDLYVMLTMVNNAPHAMDLSFFNPRLSSGEELWDHNTTDVPVPEGLEVGGTLTLRIYFDEPPEGFVPFDLHVGDDREVPLPKQKK